ncbi:MAG: tetratricopeptide repeat protein, partial [Chitinivibrionales bacterium]|nr:tetratricopeptide repeat protein [Chitinivibrionales bacterium]
MECDCRLTKFIETGAASPAMKISVFAPACLTAFGLTGCLLSGGAASKPGLLRDANSARNATTASAQADSLNDSTDAAMTEPAAPKPGELSPASELMIRTCRNYLAINPQSPKAAEVLNIEASVYYNNHMYDQSRRIYQRILTSHPDAPEALNSVRMIAQSFQEVGNFEEAEQWYRKLKDQAKEGGDKQEAIARIAESIFRMAEKYEEQEKLTEAAAQYERVALEFPESEIADVALFNAGLVYEKLTSWSHAILMYQRLMQKYHEAQLMPKARFRTAKCHAKLHQWDEAGEMYLRVTANHPRHELAPAAMYNAGFSFENGGKLIEAAATFERLAQLYPESEDAADVLFKAGELYGKLKEWESVTRVNTEFSRRFGHDKDRIVQALCMVGVALYMQEKTSEARKQLKEATDTYAHLKNPSTVNKYYAAKARFTLAECDHEAMKEIALQQPRSVYNRKLNRKADLLDKAVKSYT